MATFGEKLLDMGKAEHGRSRRKRYPCTAEQKIKNIEYTRQWRLRHPGYDQKRWIKRTNTETAEQKEKRLECSREYKATHPQCRIKSDKWHEGHPNSNRESAWFQSGVDEEWSYEKYLKMFDGQHGLCLGCGCVMVKTRKDVVPEKRLAHLDHNHTTGKVRGILCGHCNQALGNVFDNPNTLRRLADYLERFL